MYPIRKFNEKEMSNIQQYKYKTEIAPYLSTHIVQRFYDYVHLYIPNSIRPNQMTLSGGIFMLFSLIITISYDPCLNARPSWLPFVNFVCMFIYFSLDFMDGMHARRTNQCSSLGTILDHGVDSLVVSVVIITIASSLSIGISNFLFYISYNSYLGFYIVGLYLKYIGAFRHNLVAGESRALLAIMLLHLLSFAQPELINESVNYLKINLNASQICDTTLLIMSAVHTMVILIDLFYNLSKNKQKGAALPLLVSLLLPYTLLACLKLLFTEMFTLNLVPFYCSMFTFALSFTCCYMEENVTVLTKGLHNHFVFLFSILSIFTCIYTRFFNGNNLLFYIIATVVFLHFIFRIGSTLLEMFRILKVRIF